MGFDIDLLRGLAGYMDVSLGFVPPIEKNLDEVVKGIATGICDMVIPGFALSPGKTKEIAFSEPLMDITVAFLVEDH